MKLTQKNVAVFLSALMAVGTLAGCASNKSGDVASPAASAVLSAAPNSEAPIEITWTGRNPPTSSESAVQKYMEQKYNVKIKNINLDPANWKDQLNVKIAAGEIPDVFTHDAQMDQMQQWADQGVLASISVDEIKKYMPKYSAEVEKLDPNIYSYGLYKGKNWGIPRLYLEGNSPFVPVYNAAWMKAVGVSKAPETLQELEDLLTKFSNNDPDGNDKKDTFGLSGRGKDAPGQMFNSIFASYGIQRRGWNLGSDGKVYYGMVSEQARQAFKLLSKWYKDGLIDPEFVTDDWTRLRANFLRGRTGEMDSGLWYYLDELGTVGAEWKAKGQELVIGKGLKGPSGKALLLAASTITQPPQMLGVGVMKDEKKRIKILQILDDMAMNDEAYLMTRYGEKGVHYDLIGEAAIPKGEFTDPAKLGAQSGAGIWYAHLGSPTMYKHDLAKSRLDFKTKVNAGIETTKDPLNPALLPSASKVAATLDKMVDECMIKFIMGTVDTDKGFDEFVSQWMKAGGQQLTDEANQVYNERKKK
ncbi:extracellular solute-binding protein [Paenibacillus sp. Soil787]|uniref:extracellular solute-binding protein n=1 Tax=Paenibacillus sp. Soil787 TaxID=1736411 RepID=UPI0006FBF9B1|nr:extracellular solute-binding protein [Paenibacillus sp. Soil787]KRF39120.1 hypothetical protein ASG93_23430 [Paenibacillus sp. Soil787]